MNFSGLRNETFEFLKGLSDNNNHEWFQENEPVFEEHVLAPFRELVVDLAAFMAELNPDLGLGESPDVHLSRLERGVGTPPGNPPYKTSFFCFFWNTQISRLTDAYLYVGANPEGVTLGFSVYDFGQDRRARLAQVMLPRVRTDLALLDSYIKASYLRRGFQFHRYARAPGRLGMREVDAFPMRAAEWENTLGWVVSRHIHTESSRLTPGSFVTECQDTFRRLYPLYTFASDPRVDWKKRFKESF